MGFNSAFKGLNEKSTLELEVVQICGGWQQCAHASPSIELLVITIAALTNFKTAAKTH